MTDACFVYCPLVLCHSGAARAFILAMDHCGFACKFCGFVTRRKYIWPQAGTPPSSPTRIITRDSRWRTARATQCMVLICRWIQRGAESRKFVLDRLHSESRTYTQEMQAESRRTDKDRKGVVCNNSTGYSCKGATRAFEAITKK